MSSRPSSLQQFDRALILGASGHAKVIADVLECQQGYHVVGFVDDQAEKIGTKFMGYPVEGPFDRLSEIVQEYQINTLFLGVGDSKKRQSIFERLKIKFSHLHWPAIVHPSAVVSEHTAIGEAVVVMAGAVIQPGTRLHQGVLINTKASVDHDCDIHAFASVAPGACIAGSVKIGQCTFIGMGACIAQGCQVGDFSTVAAQSMVLSHIEDRTRVQGVPAVQYQEPLTTTSC